MKRLFQLLLFPLLLAACADRPAPGSASGDSAAGTQAPAPPVAASSGAAVSDSGGAPAAPYFDVESGVIELTNSPAAGTQTLYFDDSGRKQAMYIDLMMNGSRMQAVQIIDGGWFYNYDPAAKTGKRSPAPAGGLNPIPDPVTLSQERRTAYQYRAIEPATILGRKTEGYAMELSGDIPASSVQVWHWHRVPLRMRMQMPGRPAMTTEAIKAEFDLPIPEDRFRLPADIRITDESAYRQMPSGAPPAPAGK